MADTPPQRTDNPTGIYQNSKGQSVSGGQYIDPSTGRAVWGSATGSNPYSYGSPEWYGFEIGQRDSQARGNILPGQPPAGYSFVSESGKYYNTQELASGLAAREAVTTPQPNVGILQELRLEKSQKDYLNNPAIVPVSDLGDSRTQQLINQGGYTPPQAISIQLDEARLTPTKSDDRYFSNELEKALQNPVAVSSAYHNAGRDSNLPVAANPFEYLGDRSLVVLKDVQNYGWNKALAFDSPKYPVPTERTFVPETNALAWVERTGQMGEYGNLGKPFSSGVGRTLTVDEQQQIGNYVRSSELQNLPVATDTLWNLTRERVAEKTGIRQGGYVPITESKYEQGVLQKPIQEAVNPANPLNFLAKSPVDLTVMHVGMPQSNEPTNPDKQFVNTISPKLENLRSLWDKVPLPIRGVAGAGVTTAGGEFGLPAASDSLLTWGAYSPSLMPVSALVIGAGGTTLLGMGLEESIKAQQRQARQGKSEASLSEEYFRQNPELEPGFVQKPQMRVDVETPEIFPNIQGGNTARIFPNIHLPEILPAIFKPEVTPRTSDKELFPRQDKSEVFPYKLPDNTANKNKENYAEKLRNENSNRNENVNQDGYPNPFAFPNPEGYQNPNKNPTKNPNVNDNPFKNPDASVTKNLFQNPNKNPNEYPNEYPNPTSVGKPPFKIPKIDTLTLPPFSFGGGGGTSSSGKNMRVSAKTELLSWTSKPVKKIMGAALLPIPYPRAKSQTATRASSIKSMATKQSTFPKMPIGKTPKMVGLNTTKMDINRRKKRKKSW